MHAHTQDTDSIAVTEHAKLRFRQRINAADPYPGEKIREVLSRAEPDSTHSAVTNGIAWVSDEAIVVTDTAGRVAKTVLRPEVTR